MPRLKVFRTAIGFHDAYVAAPSRKAALTAWGSDKDLFARGAAEEVTDVALAAEPLERPGVVIKRLRASAAEHLASLPPGVPKKPKALRPDDKAPVRSCKAGDRAPAPRRSEPEPKARPAPSREALEAAEAALERATRAQTDTIAELARREAALARERRTIERDQADEQRRLTRRRDDAARAYDEAMARWRR